MKRLLNTRIGKIIAAVLLLAVIAGVALFLLRDRLFPQEDVIEEPEPPTPIEAPLQYTLGEVKVLAFPAGTDVLVYEEEPSSLAEQVKAIEAARAEEAAGETPVEPETSDETDTETSEEDDAGETEDAAEEEAKDGEEMVATLVAYRYEGMTNAAALVSAYAALLTTEDLGYVAADEELKPSEEIPDFTGSTGTIYLTGQLPKPESGERQAVALRLDWAGPVCTVTAELVPASMTVRPVEYLTGGFGQVLTFSGAVDAIKAMPPSALGLTGTSMEEYRVYARDGLVLINDRPCMRLDIYQPHASLGTNVAAGTYFLSSDGMELFVLEGEGVKRLKMPISYPAAVASPEEPEVTDESASLPEDSES